MSSSISGAGAGCDPHPRWQGDPLFPCIITCVPVFGWWWQMGKVCPWSTVGPMGEGGSGCEGVEGRLEGGWMDR